MNRWKGVEEFVAVVEAGNLTRAAQKLDLSVSQISKRINQLEDRVGCVLLQRTTRFVRPSQQGLAYYKSLKKMILELETAENTINQQMGGANGALKICCVGGSRAATQVNMLSTFHKRYPDISMETTFEDEMPDLLKSGVDIALVSGELVDAKYQAIKVANTDYVFCASPDFVQNYGQPETPEDLARFACIRNDSDIWHMHNKQTGKTKSIMIDGKWKSLNMKACINACIDGVGIFMVPAYSARGIFAQKKLVPLITEWRLRKSLYIAIPDPEHVSYTAQMFRDFIFDEIMEEGDGSISGIISVITDEQLKELGLQKA